MHLIQMGGATQLAFDLQALVTRNQELCRSKMVLRGLHSNIASGYKLQKGTNLRRMTW